jgi:16S rRNA (guanine(527)-N(7))-methyltransferase RsmG
MGSKPDQEFLSALLVSVERLGVPPLTESQLQRMELHYQMVTRWNRRVNLTRITTPEAAARFHYAESIYGYSLLGGVASVLDVGSGAGFPAVPLAIMNSGLSVTALEPNQKKSVFLKEVKDQLALSNLEVATARIEDFNWSGYSALASRALDGAEKIYGGLIRQLTRGQLLMLFCSDALLQALARDFASCIEIERRRIPNSQSRLIAMFHLTS